MGQHACVQVNRQGIKAKKDVINKSVTHPNLHVTNLDERIIFLKVD